MDLQLAFMTLLWYDTNISQSQWDCHRLARRTTPGGTRLTCLSARKSAILHTKHKTTFCHSTVYSIIMSQSPSHPLCVSTGRKSMRIKPNYGIHLKLLLQKKTSSGMSAVRKPNYGTVKSIEGRRLFIWTIELKSLQLSLYIITISAFNLGSFKSHLSTPSSQ